MRPISSFFFRCPCRLFCLDPRRLSLSSHCSFVLSRNLSQPTAIACGSIRIFFGFYRRYFSTFKLRFLLKIRNTGTFFCSFLCLFRKLRCFTFKRFLSFCGVGPSFVELRFGLKSCGLGSHLFSFFCFRREPSLSSLCCFSYFFSAFMPFRIRLEAADTPVHSENTMMVKFGISVVHDKHWSALLFYFFNCLFNLFFGLLR